MDLPNKPPGKPKRPGRPLTYPNGREYIVGVFDAPEAEALRDFCRSQMLDVARFLRVAALKLLAEQGVTLNKKDGE